MIAWMQMSLVDEVLGNSRLQRKELERIQVRYLQDIIAQTNRMVNGEIPLSEWEQSTATSIKNAHVNAMRVGRGGRDNTFGIHYLDVANQLRKDQYPYFRNLVAELKAGRLSRAQLDARLAMFVRSSRRSYEKGKASLVDHTRGQLFARRILDKRAENCPECAEYAARGTQPEGTLPLPTVACRCGPNCRCQIYYGTEAELALL